MSRAQQQSCMNPESANSINCWKLPWYLTRWKTASRGRRKRDRFYHYCQNSHIELFSTECRKTEIKPTTYQLDYSANLEP